MNITITGASGFVGSTLCRTLQTEHNITAIVRQESNTDSIKDLDITIKPIGLMSPEALTEATEGCDILIHCAALASDWAPKKLFFEANVEATRNVLEACKVNHIAKLIYFSSVEVWDHDNGVSYTEESRLKERVPGWYGKTKIIAEKLIKDFRGKEQCDISIVYPTWIYGEGDRVFVPEVIEAIKSGSMLYFRKGGRYPIGCVYIRNLCNLIESIIASTESRNMDFIAVDQPQITFKTFIDTLTDYLDEKPVKTSVPYFVAYGLSLLLSGTYKLFGIKKRPLLTPQTVKSLGNGVTYRSLNVEKIGYRQEYSFEQGMERFLGSMK